MFFSGKNEGNRSRTFLHIKNKLVIRDRWANSMNFCSGGHFDFGTIKFTDIDWKQCSPGSTVKVLNEYLFIVVCYV